MKEMMLISSIGVGSYTNLSSQVIRCKLSMMNGKSTNKKKATKELPTGFDRSRKEKEVWQCAGNCGACCKLDKGPMFPTPEEIFDDDPVHLQLYKSMVGPDGWCIHYEHASRTCSIYAGMRPLPHQFIYIFNPEKQINLTAIELCFEDRPYFCRVEPDVFQKLYGISERRFNKEACSSCKDTIKAVYGANSEELKNFNRTVRRTKQDRG